MSNDIVKPNPRATFAPRTFEEAKTFAHFVARSELAPKNFQGKAESIFVAMAMGGELGLTPMQALQNIAVINGRAALWGDAVLALVSGHPDCEDVKETFDEKTMTATCEIKRKARTATVRQFSKADAEKAGLWGKAGPWQQYPRRMLQMRARGFAARDAFPDALRGLISAEEAQDTPETQGRFEAAALDSGAPLPTTATVIDQPQAAPAPEPEAKPKGEGEPSAYDKHFIAVNEAQTAGQLDKILAAAAADKTLTEAEASKLVRAINIKRPTVAA